MMKQKYQYFAVIFSCLICINVCAGAAIAEVPMGSTKDVAIHQEDLLLQNIIKLLLLIKHIPLVGPKLMILPAIVGHSVANFEDLTNHLIDKILRDSLPCTIMVKGIKCEGIQKNGGFMNIVRNAINTMPNTMTFNIIKQVLNVMILTLQVLTLGSTFL